MAGKDGSPSASSTLLPLAKQLRRASVTSITSLFDKQSLNQTLDQIHSSASQSDTLTTFNDYTSPPPSTAVQRKSTDPGAGIGSWYSRMTSSVTSTKSTRSAGQDLTASRVSTGRSGDTPVTTANETSGAASSRDRANTSNSATPSEALTESHSSLRAPSRKSQYSQAAESAATSPADFKKPEGSNVASRGASHKAGPSISSQVSSSQASALSGQESKAEGKPTPVTLKRAMTPEPSAPASPLLQDLERSRTSLSLVLERSNSRTPSVSSSSGTRRPNEGRRESARPAITGPEQSPTLSRFSSAPNVKIEYDQDRPSQTQGLFEEDVSFQSSKRSSSPQKGLARDAITSLKRVQSQAPGSTNLPKAQVQATASTLSQLRNRVLSRQYWMKDENARDCFYCGDPFSTFRRKHHCRTCGQIFDAKCTTLVSGGMFGQSGSIRVCKPCEGLINGYDDSSEYTDDDTASIMTSRTKHRQGSKGGGDASPTRPSTPGMAGSKGPDSGVHGARSNLNTFKSHFPSVISRRVIDDLKRSSGQYDDDSDRKSIRPASSRSLKSSHGMRPHTSHRRHYSKHLLQRTPRTLVEEKAPFYQGSDPATAASDRRPAFHSDNVIDPDLAAYLSDDAESDDDDHTLAGALAGAEKGRIDQTSASNPGTMLKRPRSRYGDSLKLLTGSQIEYDAASVNSSKVATPVGHLRRRNVSFTGSAFQSSPPKPQRLSVAAQQWSSPSLDGLAGSVSHGRYDAGHMTRSISMQGPRAPPVELNNASLQHGRRLLRQLLNESSVTNVEGWEKALMPIFLRATDDVVPNVQDGDAMNITNYVKLKKIPGGKMGDTAYISGVVFSKNVALKSMVRSISNPNIVIVTFALEYSRHEQHFMSLDPIVRQEKEYLRNLVNRIAALKPELLLVQRNVSGVALEMLEKAKISTAYNVKRSVLEAISRCCQTRVITSLDKLATQPDSHSSCEFFYLRTFQHEQRRKTYMYLSGCPRELGCTIVLRGGNTSTLRRIKRVAEFMLQAIYNLRLETSLMRDEFALIPHYGAEGTIRYDAHLIPRHEIAPPLKHDLSRPATASGEVGSILSTVSHDDGRANSINVPSLQSEDKLRELLRSREPLTEKAPELPDDIPAPTFYSDLVEKQRTRILSTSPFVKFMQPYLLMRARESERTLMHLKRLLDQDIYDLSLADDSKPDKFLLITPEMIDQSVQGTSRKIREIIHAVHESEYDKATHVYKTQTKQWEASVIDNADMFNPISHQSITVLHSLISTSTNIACSGPDIFTIKFYDDRGSEEEPEADCTLGQYVEDTCMSAGEACHINGCEKKMYQHHRHYVHGEGRLEVTIERSPPKAPGLDQIPLMWSACRICGKETQAVPISANTWTYSFGKYLELAFWSISLRPRADICPHDLHHDHWRFFGYKNWAIRIQYDTISILEVIVPRTRITWKVVNDLKFKNENFRKAEKRLNKFVASVKARLKSIRVDTLLPEKVEECGEEIERLNKLILDDHGKVLEKLQEKYEGSKFYEIVPFNRAMRLLHEKAGEWDEIFADFADNYLPSEKDIKRLATIQVKKLLFGPEDSGGSLTSPEDPTNTSFTNETNEEISPEGTLASATESQIMSPEQAEDVMAAVVEGEAQRAIEEDQSLRQATIDDEEIAGAALDTESPVVDNLDLAVSSPTSPRPRRTSITMSLDGDATPVSSDSATDKDEQPSSIDSPSGDAPQTLVTNEIGHHERGKPRASAIPRYTAGEHSRRKSNGLPNITGQRSQSQPAHVRQLAAGDVQTAASPTPLPPSPLTAEFSGETSPKTQRKLSQRLAGLRNAAQSKIPRSVKSNRKDNRVSALAKHFEQLISREFQQERLRDQRKRAGRQRQAGAYPAAALRPVVEVYHFNMHEGGGEPENAKAEDGDNQAEASQESASTAQALSANPLNETEGDGFHAPGAQANRRETDDTLQMDGTRTESNEAAGEYTEDGEQTSQRPASGGDGEPEEELLDSGSTEEDLEDLELDIPRHEKTSIIKMVTNFWAERSASGWEPLYYPLRDLDHVFANSDIIVREDEPSSLIALALDGADYQESLREMKETTAEKPTRKLSEKTYVEDMFLTAEEQASIERSLLQDTGRHLNYHFERGSARMQCKIFWAEQFEAVRKKCGVSERIVESLSRCLKWDSKGGKTNSVFLKTLDDRFVLKSLSSVETRSFLRFAPYYFSFISHTLLHELPSSIAKLLGFFQVTIKDPTTNTDFDWYLLLMENLFYARVPEHTFDLKGSMRNRRVQPTGEQNEVLLDENFLDYLAERPLFCRDHSKKLLRSSIYNDTLFLNKRNVMDYSLMLGIEEEKRELVVGIIDCIRTYTWDKKLESWVKDRGKNRPTVTEPRDYKNRFREAINHYVRAPPDCWQAFGSVNLGVRSAVNQAAMEDEEIAPDEVL